MFKIIKKVDFRAFVAKGKNKTWENKDNEREIIYNFYLFIYCQTYYLGCTNHIL